MRVVLGCGNFGGIGSAPAFFGQGETREQAFDLMDAAWALGVDRFDTADAYGGGRSETWIGDWIAASGNRPRITSKTFNAMEDGADFGLARERVLRQVESSLARLRVERIDLYLTHEPDPDTPVEETFATFAALAERGLIDTWGVSNVTARRPAPLARARDSLARTELVLAAGARRRAGGDPALRAAWHRVPGVQPARRRLADREVPAGRRAAGRLADDHAAGAVPPPRQRAGPRRDRAARGAPLPRAGSAPRRWRWPGHSAEPDRSWSDRAARSISRTSTRRCRWRSHPAEREEVGSFFGC